MLAITQPLTAQDALSGCASSVKAADVAPMLMRQARGLYDVPTEALAGVLEVPITFHICRPSDGVGGMEPTRIDELLASLNATYAGAGMSFCQPGRTQYIDNDFWFSQIDESFEIDALLQLGPVPNTVNIYVVGDLRNEDDDLCGRGSFTDSAVQGVIVNFTCTNLEALVEHEVGHFFDLLHTHETALGTECPNGWNCGFDGDLVCDTPADFNLADCVDADCDLMASCQDQYRLCTFNPGGPVVAFYDPLLDNIMSYARRSCRMTMTQGQLDRARATLVNLRPNLINGCTTGNICGESDAGNCFAVHAGAGCDNADCCQIVCSIDPTCCILGWDQGCADLAAEFCGSCGSEDAPSCADDTTGLPGCSDPACCTAVCAIDAFCCDSQWDSVCVDLAIANCLVPGDEPANCITAVDGENDGYLGDNLGWTGDDTLPAPCATGDEIDEWYCYTATCTGLAVASTCGSTLFDSALGVYNSSTGALIQCNDNAIGPVTTECDPQATGSNTASIVSWSATSGETYLIRVSLAEPAIGFSYDLHIECRPPECGEFGTGDCFTPHGTASCNDADCCEAVCVVDSFCCDNQWDNVCVNLAQATCSAPIGEECLSAVPIVDGLHPVNTADNEGLNPPDSSCGGGVDVLDEWYAYTAPYSCAATARICAFLDPLGGVPFFTLSAFEDCAGTELVCGDDNFGCALSAASAQIIWSVTEGETYYVRLSTPVDSAGGGTLEINSGGCGLATAGDCFVANGSRGCEDTDCCAAVCQADPFCCTIFWDGECALVAAALCGCDGDITGPSGSPDQQVDVLDLLLLLSNWGMGGTGADIAPPTFVVDVNDLLGLLAEWGNCE